MASTNQPEKQYTVLLVDDSEDDRLFMRLALRQSSRLAVIGELQDGEETIAYLSGQSVYGDRKKFPFPDVLILDLKMPRKTGYDVLLWWKEQSFPPLHIIVVSGSFLPEDVTRSFSLGASAYHQKSVLKKEQTAMVQKIESLLRGRTRSPKDSNRK